MPKRRYQQRRTSSINRSGTKQSGVARYGKQEVLRNRVVALLVIVVILLLVGIMGCGALAPSNQGKNETSSTSSSAASEGAGPSAAGMPEGNGTLSTESSQVDSGAQEDLVWRDSEFAVDPNRTDWSYTDNGRKVVYLTIDDGPSENTQAVLDILDRYGCKATFFVVGQDPAYFPMIKEAYYRGHTIGLHTYSHDYAYIYSSQQAYFEDLDSIGEVVRDQIGYVPCFIRFPGGSSNSISANYTSGIMSELVNEVQARGYQYYDWNVSSGDGSDHTADDLVYFATEEAPEYDNIVLLMHDSSTKQTSVEALPRIIEYYQERGYTFEAIDRTTYVPHHGVNN